MKYNPAGANMHLGLRAKLLLPIIAVITFAFCGGIILVVDAANRSIEAAGRLFLTARVQTLADVAAASIQRAKDDSAVSATIPLVLSTLDFSDTVGFSSAADKQLAADTLLVKIANVSGIYETLYTTNAKGMALACSLPTAVGELDISNRDWFHNAMNNTVVTFSEPFISRITGDVLAAVCRPVTYNGQQGTLTASMRTCTTLHAALGRTEDSYSIRAMVLSAKGMVLASLDHGIVANVSYADAPWYTVMPAQQRGTVDAIVDGKEMVVGYSRLAEGWTAIIFAEKKVLLAASRTVTFIGLCALGLALLFSTMGVFWVVRSVTRDIGVLADYAQIVSQGQAAAPPVMGRHDELGTLGKHLIRMVESLRKSISAAEEANRLKGQFLANMSHEIRTPMNGILGMCYLCLGTELTPSQRDYVSKAQTSARNLLGILNDILDFSKIEAQRLVIEHNSFKLSRVLTEVKDVVGVQAQEAGLALHLRVSPDVPAYLVGDPLRLRQVLLNLVGNAIKFTRQGTVSVDVTQATPPAEIPQNLHLSFVVRDTGIGISEEGLNFLFQPFSQVDGSMTRRFGGTGLGLAISRHLVEMMGGRIQAESVPTQGSTFSFTLPFALPTGYADIDAASKQPVDAVLNAAFKGRHVLLVEDVDINQEIAREVLTQAGLLVTICENGQEAVNNITAGKVSFDVILMDIQMPVMDGLEATRRIRALAGHEQYPPIIAMTAHALPEEREKSLQAGMVDHLTKPLDIGQIFTILNRWLTR